jgi:hypothetical protein
MANQKVQIKKTVYSNVGLSKIVDREFRAFANPIPVQDTDTVGELFRLYDKLYLDIPVNGESDSHEYLITRSSELVDVDIDNEAIQPLLDEISELRQQLLEANIEITKLNTNLANGGN